jgi:hypothetical protein
VNETSAGPILVAGAIVHARCTEARFNSPCPAIFQGHEDVQHEIRQSGISGRHD